MAQVFLFPTIPIHREPQFSIVDPYDVQALAAEAAKALEAYQRAPWTGMNDGARMAKLRQALELLTRIEALETGKIPMKVWGD